MRPLKPFRHRASLFRKLSGFFTRRGDREELFFRLLSFGAASSIPLLLVDILVVLYQNAKPAFSHLGWSFFISAEWAPMRRSFGALPFIYGTAVSSLFAIALALPLGISASICLAELTPPALKPLLGSAIELLAAIPSVVYGLWGLFVLIPWLQEVLVPFLQKAFPFLPFFQGPFYGPSLLAAGLVLAVMIVPTIVDMGRDLLQAVPSSLIHAAYALGATRWEVLRFVVLPYVRSGFAGAAALALGRALGETMACAMLIGNHPQIKASLFAPAATVTSVIANEFAEASDPVYFGALMALALLLFLVTLVFNIGARLLVATVYRGALR